MEAMSCLMHRPSGVPNLFVLTLTTGKGRLPNLLAAAQNLAGAPRLLFKATEDGGLRTPLPNLVSEPWSRAGLDVLSIAESV
jgi:hypothetical protein